MSTSDADTFQNRIATFAQNLPVEIARAREAEGGKKVWNFLSDEERVFSKYL